MKLLPVTSEILSKERKKKSKKESKRKGDVGRWIHKPTTEQNSTLVDRSPHRNSDN